MLMSVSGEEDVLRYKHTTKMKTHSAHAARALLSFLPRPPLSCRLAPSAPRLEQQAKLRKRGKNGSKSGHAGVQQEQQQPCLRHKYNEED